MKFDRGSPEGTSRLLPGTPVSRGRWGRRISDQRRGVGAMNTTSKAVENLPIEVITLPVAMSSERRGFMSIRSALRSTSTIRRTTRSAWCNSLRLDQAVRSRSVADSPTRRSDHFAKSISSSPTSRLRGTAHSNVGSKSVRSGTRYPSMPGTEVSHPGSTPRTGITPASPSSPIQMAIAGCCRNGATAMRDVLRIFRNTHVVEAPEEGRCRYPFLLS